jgi:hypothetical protein
MQAGAQCAPATGGKEAASLSKNDKDALTTSGLSSTAASSEAVGGVDVDGSAAVSVPSPPTSLMTTAGADSGLTPAVSSATATTIISERRGRPLHERYVTNHSGPRHEVSPGLILEEIKFWEAARPLLGGLFGHEVEGGLDETTVYVIFGWLISEEYTMKQLRRFTAQPHRAMRRIVCVAVHTLFREVTGVTDFKPGMVMSYMLTLMKGDSFVASMKTFLSCRIALVSAVRVAEFHYTTLQGYALEPLRSKDAVYDGPALTSLLVRSTTEEAGTTLVLVLDL